MIKYESFKNEDTVFKIQLIFSPWCSAMKLQHSIQEDSATRTCGHFIAEQFSLLTVWRHPPPRIKSWPSFSPYCEKDSQHFTATFLGHLPPPPGNMSLPPSPPSPTYPACFLTKQFV